MTLHDVVTNLNLSVCHPGPDPRREVTGAYVSDLLSDVIANSKAGEVWITMQGHVNIVAVAVLKELAGVILVSGRNPAAETLQKAASENIAVLVSPLPAYETAGRLYMLETEKAT